MKIHTVKKYLKQLPKKPVRNLTAHYKMLADAVCKNLKIRPINNITLAVTGYDAGYTAECVSSAMKNAGISSATVNFDVNISPDSAVTVNGEPLRCEAASRIFTVIRTVSRSLNAKFSDEFPIPCVYEVYLLGVLCACSEMGVAHIILSFNAAELPLQVASLIPQPKMIHCNAIYPDETKCIGLVARRTVEEIISSPQQKDSRLALAALCSEINCNHTVVARGEIEAGVPTYKGIPFSYRGFSAIAGTHMVSMLVAPVTALVTIRELTKLRIRLNDAHAYQAINLRKIPGRGQLISVRPLTISCVCDPADTRFAGLVVSDLRSLSGHKGRKIDIIIQGAVENEENLIEILRGDKDSGLNFGAVVTVTEPTENPHSISGIQETSIKNALVHFPYLSDNKHTDDTVLVVLGSNEFIVDATIELEDAVRDNFSY